MEEKLSFQAAPEEILKSRSSITGKYLSGKKSIEFSSKDATGNGKEYFFEAQWQ